MSLTAGTIQRQLFIDLLKKVDIERVLFYLEKLGESKKSLDSYKTVYNNLLTMEVKDNKEMYIFVVEEKDYFEDEKYFNVLGLDIKDGESYAIEFMDWSDWLGSNVVEKSVEKLGSVIFVAECLKEMTFLGFEEERMTDPKLRYMVDRGSLSSALENPSIVVKEDGSHTITVCDLDLSGNCLNTKVYNIK